MKRRIAWLIPLFLGLFAAGIPVGMRTGAANYEFWQGLRCTLLFAAFVSIPAIMMVRRAIREHSLRKTRARRYWGQCQNCGYDLRASQKVCPECGTAASPSVSTEHA